MPIFLEAYISSLVDLYFESIPGVIQVIIKFDKRCFLFDGISTKDTRCSDLFPLLQARLGFKIPGHARLMENGRIKPPHFENGRDTRTGASGNESRDQVLFCCSLFCAQAGLMDSCTLEVFLCNPAGARIGARTRAP